MIWKKVRQKYTKNARIITNINRELFNKLCTIFLPNNNNILWINNPYDKPSNNLTNSSSAFFLNYKKVFITRCNAEFVNYYIDNGFEVLKFGKEALLNLERNHFVKKSLQELIKKGLKVGNIIELNHSIENLNKLNNFKNECIHESEPQLKYVFNDVLLPSNRLFIFLGNNNLWLGAITISNKGKKRVTTDLMLRRKNAPKGVMEGLIFNIFNILKNEEYEYWSLGEVPFIIYDSPILTKEFMLNYAGRKLIFAYNYLGLYNFKNKFNPVWEETYLCGKPNLNLSSLLFIAYLTNLFKLVITKIKIHIS